jgi:primosomal protein N' (replication factor Y)
VLVLRAEQTGCAALLAGYARTAEVQALLAAGWAQPLEAARAQVRARAPRVEASGEQDGELARDPAARAARLPHRAFVVVRTALAEGPVLVQVPRAGYVPALACQRCRRTAQCGTCAGPLVVASAGAQPSCRWCGRLAVRWQCPHCGGDRLRAPAVGAARTAEELGRAFPATPVRRSGGDAALELVDDRPALVVATPGAEPLAAGGYRAALILDSWLTLVRADLRTAEESLRRWLNAAALVRPTADGGRVVVVGDASVPAIQALVRWDPGGFAERELAERTSARLPPAVRLASVTGPAAAVRELVDDLELPAGAETFGPVPVDEESVRAVVRAPHPAAVALSEALLAGQARRSARKLASVRVQVDPMTLG